MAVIDDPLSIIRCTNKVYLKELFEKEKISAPKSTLIFQSNDHSFEQISEQVGAPFILKIPDGSPMSFCHIIFAGIQRHPIQQADTPVKLRRSECLLTGGGSFYSEDTGWVLFHWHEKGFE